jgi:hypothetical protein
MNGSSEEEKPGNPQENKTHSGDNGGKPNDARFFRYLDEVAAASRRSRTVIYVLIVVMIAIFGVHRSMNDPGWTKNRLRLIESAYCGLLNPEKSTDGSGIRYVNKQILPPNVQIRFTSIPDPTPQMLDQVKIEFQPTPAAPQPTPAAPQPTPAAPQPTPAAPDAVKDVLRSSIDAYTRARMEQAIIRLPILGLAFDINDLALTGGLILAALLYILASSIRREVLNLEIARKYIQESSTRREASNPKEIHKPTGEFDRDSNLSLLRMVQVLAPALQETPKGGFDRFLQMWLPYLFLTVIIAVLPVVVQAMVFCFDLSTIDIGAMEQGNLGEYAMDSVEFAVTVLVAVLAFLCGFEQYKLHCSLVDLTLPNPKQVNEH